MTNQIDIEEGASRQHRALGLLAALYCWHNSAKATWLTILSLEQIIGISFTKQKRLEWIIRDLSDYFPYVYTHTAKSGNKLLVMSIISRDTLELDESQIIQFNPKLMELQHFKPVLFDTEREELQSEITKYFPFINGVNNTAEAAIQINLSLLSQGMVTPKDVF